MYQKVDFVNYNHLSMKSQKYIYLLFSLLILAFVIEINANPRIHSLENRLKTSSEKERYVILLQLSTEYEDVFNDYSINYAEQALELAIKLKNKNFETEAIGRIGSAYISASQFGRALEYYQKYKLIAERTNDRQKMSNAYVNIGFIYKQWADFNTAIEFYLKALKIAEETGDKLSKINAYENIGLIYTDWGKLDKALENLQKDLALSNELKDKQEIIKSYMALGKYYTKAKSITMAQINYFKAIQLAEEIGKKSLIAKCYVSLGDLQINNPNKFAKTQKEKYEKAYDFYQSAYKQYKDIFNNIEMGKTLIKISNVNFLQENSEEAIRNLNEGLEIIKKQNLRNEMKEAYEISSKIYFKSKNYEKAFNNLKQYSDLKDSIFSDENNKKISEMQVRLETEKQEKNIEILKKEQDNSKYILYLMILAFVIVIIILIALYSRFKFKNEINKELQTTNNQLEETNSKLTASEKELMSLNSELADINLKLTESELDLKKLNATKDKFFSIIAHDLKNPIHALMFSTEVLLSIKIELDTRVKKQISGMHSTSKQLYNLLNNLLIWASSQSNNIEYNPMIQDLHEIIFENIELNRPLADKKNIDLRSNTKPMTTAYIDLNAIKTVIRNLITNAIKFTQDGGTISIDVEDNGEELFVIISDSGVGIKPEDVEKLFKIDVYHSTKGTAQESGTGLGLTLCREFVEMNKGKIWVESTVGVGSKFIFSLPK